MENALGILRGVSGINLRAGGVNFLWGEAILWGEAGRNDGNEGEKTMPPLILHKIMITLPPNNESNHTEQDEKKHYTDILSTDRRKFVRTAFE